MLGASPVHAQTYPTQPIRLIVPFAPGGGMESAVRTVVQKINESGWPQLIVDNRPGGAGTIAALATKQAPPDGYTLMLAAISTHAINATLIPDLKYDPLKDFTPITLLFSYPSVVAVPANSPAKTLADLVEMAKTRPGGITYGSPGIGTLGHILPLMLERASGTQMVHVPYRGGGPAMLDLLAGRTDFMILNPAGIIPNVEAGRLRTLARDIQSAAPLPAGCADHGGTRLSGRLSRRLVRHRWPGGPSRPARHDHPRQVRQRPHLARPQPQAQGPGLDRGSDLTVAVSRIDQERYDPARQAPEGRRRKIRRPRWREMKDQ